MPIVSVYRLTGTPPSWTEAQAGVGYRAWILNPLCAGTALRSRPDRWRSGFRPSEWSSATSAPAPCTCCAPSSCWTAGRSRSTERTSPASSPASSGCSSSSSPSNTYASCCEPTTTAKAASSPWRPGCAAASRPAESPCSWRFSASSERLCSSATPSSPPRSPCSRPWKAWKSPSRAWNASSSPSPW